MTATVTLAVVGKVGPYRVVTDEAVETLYEKLTAGEGPHVVAYLGELGELRTAEITPNSVTLVRAPSGNVVQAAVELPD